MEPSTLFSSEDGGRTYELVRGLWDHPTGRSGSRVVVAWPCTACGGGTSTSTWTGEECGRLDGADTALSEGAEVRVRSLSMAGG